jgi:DNA polymerase III subunit delta
MQTRLDLRAPDGLKRTLSAHATASIWVITGDDPLLTGEAADQCREHFRSLGVTERQVEVPDRSFDWKGWLAASGTGSLFSEKRLMDVRLPTGKPGIEGSKAIQAWCAHPPEDVILLVNLPRADRALLGSSWFSALDQAGVVIVVPELYRSDLPSWVSQRLRAQGLTATPDAIAFICDQCEGNLIAAHQEILKLALHGENHGAALDVHDIRDHVANVARFNAFTLGEAALGLDRPRAIRILRGLKSEAEPIPLVLWALTEDLRMLARTQSAMARGRTADMAIREARVPRHRERLIANACRSIQPMKTWRALRQAAEVDTIVKGLKSDDPWVALERLVLDLA